MTSPITAIRRIIDGGGRHRAPAVRHVAVPLDELLGPWRNPLPARERPHGAAFTPEWGDCPVCDKTTAGSANKDGWTCGECLTPVPVGGA